MSSIYETRRGNTALARRATGKIGRWIRYDRRD